MLGYGPLEPLLSRDDIADIMVNGAGTVFIEVAGKIQKTGIRFRDNQQLLNICQRIVSQVGRRVDESSPICDARLPDGSRVNVIAPPLAIDGPALTIRKFKDKLTLDQLVRFGTYARGKTILEVIGACDASAAPRHGSGKTRCSTVSRPDPTTTSASYREAGELNCAAHVGRSRRAPQPRGEGDHQRDLVRNCLRMRTSASCGEVRGPEASTSQA